MIRTTERRAFLLDLVFASALLAVAALWLVVFRRAQWIHTWPGLAAFGGVFAGLVAGWTFAARRSADGAISEGGAVIAPQSIQRRFWSLAWLCFGLLLLTDVAFYQPLKIHFWGGWDDFVSITKAPLWNPATDESLGRPFNTLPCQIALWLTPGRIEGSLWVASALCFLNGLLLFSLIRRVMPGALIPAVAAAALLIVNRGDTSRFYVMWTTNFYWTPLFFVLAAFWLFLVSYQRQSRLLLVVSCGLLASSFLSSEGAFPLSVLGLVLLWLIRRHRQQLWVWAFAWCGTVAVMGARLVLNLMGRPHSYQAQQASDALHDPSIFLTSFKMHLGAMAAYFPGLAGWGSYWSWGLAALPLILLLFVPFIFGAKDRSRSVRRQYVAAMILGAAALVLGMLPFLHMPGLFRTAFLSAPGEATLLAFALALLGTFLPARLGCGFVAVCTGALAALSVTDEFREQNYVHEESAVTFEKTVHIFDQVHGLCPQFPAGSLILFILDDGNTASFFGSNYSLFFTSTIVLGTGAVQVNFSNAHTLDCNAIFGTEDVTVAFGDQNARIQRTRYDKVAAFRVSQDGTVMFLDKLPPALLPENSHSAEYQPLALMNPGPITPLPYLRYARWMEPMRDVLDTNSGVMLDASHWGPLAVTHDRMYREVADGAQIAMNPMGDSQRKLVLSVRPPKEHTGPWTLQALNADGTVGASVALSRHQDVTLNLPVDPRKISVFSLRLWETAALAEGKTPEPLFRIYCRKLKTPPRLIGGKDICDRTVQLGQNWNALERYEGEFFRWVNNDAEITLSPFAPLRADLVMNIEPGPGMAGSPCHLELQDADGKPVAETTFANRSTIRLPLPKPLKRDAPYRLHVIGGGAPAPNGDTRILNFRVFDCAAKE